MAWKRSSREVINASTRSCEGSQAGSPLRPSDLLPRRLTIRPLFQDQVVLRLSQTDATDLTSKGGRAFEPIKGRRSKDRVVLPKTIAANRRLLRKGVDKAVAYSNQ